MLIEHYVELSEPYVKLRPDDPSAVIRMNYQKLKLFYIQRFTQSFFLSLLSLSKCFILDIVLTSLPTALLFSHCTP